MCSRFHLKEEHYREMLAQLGIAQPAVVASRFNIAPGTAIPVVRSKPRSTAREAGELRWGLVPSWAKSDASAARLVNARAETLAEKPSFRNAWRTRRCLVPASGFFEWETVGRTKRPWLFSWRDESPLALAGLWESWTAPDGSVVESCALITTAANELMRPIHDRMPVLLTSAHFDAWLDPHLVDPAPLLPLLQPVPADAMIARRVNSCVNSVRADGPQCLEPARENETPASPPESDPQLPLW